MFTTLFLLFLKDWNLKWKVEGKKTKYICYVIVKKSTHKIKMQCLQIIRGHIQKWNYNNRSYSEWYEKTKKSREQILSRPFGHRTKTKHLSINKKELSPPIKKNSQTD